MYSVITKENVWSFLCYVFCHYKGKYPELILSVVFFMRVMGKKCSVRYTCAEKRDVLYLDFLERVRVNYEVNFIL